MKKTLLRQVTSQFLSAMLIAALLISAVTLLLHDRAMRHVRKNRTELLIGYYQRWITANHQDFLREGHAMLTGIEYARIIGSPSSASARLESYFRAMRTGPHTIVGAAVLDQSGRLMAHTGSEANIVSIATGTTPWHMDAHEGLLYRAHRQDLMIGGRGAGRALLLQPIGDNLLQAAAAPGSELFLLWNGRTVASSLGRDGVKRFPDQAGIMKSSSPDETAFVVPWAAPAAPLDATPMLAVRTRFRDPLPLSELIGTTAAALALLLLFFRWSIGAWLGRIVGRIEALRDRAHELMQLHLSPFHPMPPLDRQPGMHDELAELDATFSSMALAIQTREREIQASEQRYRTLHQSLADGFVSVGMDGRLTDCNKAYEMMLGYSHEELMSLSYIDLTPLAWHEMEARIVRDEVLPRGYSQVYEKEYRRRDGAVFPVELRTFLLKNDAGMPSGMWAIVRDITERKRSQDELRRSYDEANRFRMMVEFAQQAIGTANLDSMITYGNSALVSMLGVGSLEELRQYSFRDFYADAELARLTETVLPEVMRRGSWIGEVNLRSLTGRIIPTIHSLYLIRDGHGEPIALSNVITDITERARADEAIRGLLDEKETLLREIHHRVKNNLQIIASLLFFQAKKLQDPASLAVLREGQDRLKSMILIHEKLYHSRDLSNIDFGDYVRSLSGQVLKSYDTLKGRVSLAIEVSNIFIPIEIALPCGMIINELMTNVFKYAFPEGRSGRLSIRVVSERDRMVITIGDDGIGLPPDIDPLNPKSFGLTLVKNLTKQLDATIAITREGGATTTIAVPLRDGKGQP